MAVVGRDSCIKKSSVKYSIVRKVQKRDLTVKVNKRFNTVQWGILTKYSVFSKKVVYSKWEIG